ncbi:MAG: Coenzyme F420 hydrogenase/dehydrogenase, beta subunit C-terminal domain [Elusimicrobia bacterium]|nr:Coenzyme F420 hydrogenase/dehydrogenase, beta subunit C-terminal domain [Elusimicrobiota bacterium]
MPFATKEYCYKMELGVYDKIFSATSLDKTILEKASSGGIMTAIAEFLLKENFVDGIIVTKINVENGKILPMPYIARNKEDLLLAQGSKYMPVPLLSFIKTLSKSEETFALIGTPCQIAGLHLMQEKNPKYKQIIKYTIGNFCGGFRDLREIYTIFNRLKISAEDVENFSYRGGGQPGFLTIKTREGIYKIAYPKYNKMTGFSTIRRCRLCVDATAELADFSCGDAWLKKFLNKKECKSIIITRNKNASNILELMEKQKYITRDKMSIDDVIEAQKTNIYSKKIRQKARRKIFSILCKKLPDFKETSFSSKNTRLLTELKVLLSHSIFYCLQVLGLYTFIAKLIKRDNAEIIFEEKK